MTLQKRILLTLVFIVWLTGCSDVQSASLIEADTAVPTEIGAERARNPEQGIRTAGKVVLTELYNLGFSISGQVSEISIKRGDFVSKGTVIAVLDTTPLLISIAQAEGSLALAEARLKRVQAGPHKSEIAEAKAQVTAIAAKPTEYGSKIDDRAADLAAARARLDFLLAQPLPEDVAVAQAEVTQAQLNLDATRAQLELAKLVAPADGTVIKVLLNPFEYARTGETIVQMGDLQSLSVQTQMYDFEIVSIKIGEVAGIRFDSMPDVEIKGTVSSIEPDETVNQGGRYLVLIRLDEHPAGLRWGMTAQVHFARE